MLGRYRDNILRIGLVIALLAAALPAYALVNINTAGVEELDVLYGIGPAKAQDIIDYRNGPNGPFETIEEIMEVSGIGTATFEKIKNDITVGDASLSNNALPAESQTVQNDTPPEATASGGGVFIEDTKSISVDVGNDRTVFVGADSAFDALVTGAVGDPIENARVIWAFGDGGRKQGQHVLYNFAYPGTYVVTADAANDVYSASDRVVVKAIPARITVSRVTPDYIALKNDTGIDVDIGAWLLFSAGKQFQFPEHTVILSGQEVFVSNKRTGLSGYDPGTVALQYPNGLVATAYQYPLFIAQSAAASTANTSVATAASFNATADVARDVSDALQQNLVTAPIVATGGSFGVWPWFAGLVILSGAGGGALVYARRRKVGYTIEEIS